MDFFKVIGHLIYYTSMGVWYNFFLFLLVGHLYFASFQPDWKCFANKRDLTSYIGFSSANATESGFPQEESEHVYDVSKDFLTCNILGVIVFVPTLCMLVLAHYKWHKGDQEYDNFILPMMFTGFSWFIYFMCLNVFRLRHTGRVCSGSYLEGVNHMSFILSKGLQEPYLIDNGFFLWLALVTQYGFMVVMASGAMAILD